MAKKVIGNRINNITIINSRDFVFSFTSNREEKLLVSLNHQNPFIWYTKNIDSITTMVNKTNEILRKELKDALITQVEILNEDKILLIKVQRTNDYFEREKKEIIIELIPQRSNLILVDNERKVLFALNYSPLETVRPLLKGITYIAPNKKDTFAVDTSDPDIKGFDKYVREFIFESKHKRLMERYDLLFKHIKSRAKSQKQKIKVLSDEIEIAKGNLKYQEIGNMVLALSGDEEEFKTYLEDNKVSLNKDFTIGQNANLFFKKYKKAKRTIEMDGIELEKAQKEIEKLESINAQINYMDDEDLYELAMELMPNKFIQSKNKKTKSKLSYVLLNNTKIYFGKNAKQNNEITFELAKPHNTYMHIKDYHGAHVLIANDNPTNDELLVAAEICLILSNKAAGDIMYTQISNVRKGSYLGEAILKTYKLITLTSVRESTYDLIKKWENK